MPTLATKRGREALFAYRHFVFLKMIFTMFSCRGNIRSEIRGGHRTPIFWTQQTHCHSLWKSGNVQVMTLVELFTIEFRRVATVSQNSKFFEHNKFFLDITEIIRKLWKFFWNFENFSKTSVIFRKKLENFSKMASLAQFRAHRMRKACDVTPPLAAPRFRRTPPETG